MATDGGHGEGHVDGADAVGGQHADHGHGHHGGWDARGWLGGESTWFMLGPILFAATGSIVLGVAPDTAVFLRIVRDIVAAVTGVSV